MFTKQTAAFLYAISPVHMGTGSATGVIDNPIQRERHTNHPSFAGSGIKGAVRHAFPMLIKHHAEQHDTIAKLRDIIFGPDADSDNLHAGAVSFGDAQLVAFPVRSLRGGYVYATCPQALARTQRLLRIIGRAADWQIPEVPTGQCRLSETAMAELTRDGQLDLEIFQYSAQADAGVANIADWLARQALHPDYAPEFFGNKLRDHLVVLADTDFEHFVRNATLVETHVRIDEKTGAAADGGLFNTENLPPESLLIAPVMASNERTGNQNSLKAEDILGRLRTAVQGRVIQLGGDATTGRGLVGFNLLEGGK